MTLRTRYDVETVDGRPVTRTYSPNVAEACSRTGFIVTAETRRVDL